MLDQLDGLPRAAWLELGRRVASSDDSREWATACAALDGVIDARQLAVAAWLVRDAVLTAAHLAPHDVALSGGRRRPPPPPTAEERAALDAAQRAAAAAALARLVRPWLARAHVAALVAPLRTGIAARVPFAAPRRLPGGA